MKEKIIVSAAVLMIACAAFAGAQVSLGISAGAAVPSGTIGTLPENGTVSLNWGFYVDIPLIYTFHITPSSELYKLGGENATDMSLAFKFIVPLGRWRLYAGFVPGLTAVSTVTSPHVGVSGGFSLDLVSNIDLFAQLTYKVLFYEEARMSVAHPNLGLLFTF